MARLKTLRPWVTSACFALCALALDACSSSDDQSSGSGGAAGTAASGGTSNAGSAGQASGGSAGSSGGGGGSAGAPDTSPMGGDRPVTPFIPESYNAANATPLVVMLHGFGASGGVQETIIFQLKALAEEKTFIYIYPDGTVGADGRRFWNATDWCCDLNNTGVDDVAYLSGLIAEAKQRYNIDDKRVYMMGHSNGGFMSHRFACDHPELLAGIASLAGAGDANQANCTPSVPVNVLQMHGTDDQTVSYTDKPGLPGAEQTVANWAKLNGCTSQLTPLGTPADYVSGDDGAETDKLNYSGCAAGGAVELWRMNGAGHIPGLTDAYRRDLVEWLLAHPKP